jgi:hypothetical protein
LDASTDQSLPECLETLSAERTPRTACMPLPCTCRDYERLKDLLYEIIEIEEDATMRPVYAARKKVFGGVFEAEIAKVLGFFRRCCIEVEAEVGTGEAVLRAYIEWGWEGEGGWIGAAW